MIAVEAQQGSELHRVLSESGLSEAPEEARGGLPSELPKVQLEGELSPLPDVPEGLRLERISGSSLLILSFTEEPKHASDPLTWRASYRWYLTGLAAILVLNTSVASSAPSGAGPFLQAQYGDVTVTCIAAPNWKALLVLRFVSGFFGAVPTTSSGAVCGDIWAAKDRGTPLSLYSISTFAGPAYDSHHRALQSTTNLLATPRIGPILGSYTSLHLNWRYCFVILTSYSVLVCLLVAFTCAETYPQVILTKVAKNLRQSLDDSRIVSRQELAEIVTRGTMKWPRFKSEVKRIVGTPLLMLVQEPTVVAVTAFLSLVYALIYLLFVAYPIIFNAQGIYHMQPGTSSLPLLGIMVGTFFSFPFSMWYHRRYMADAQAEGRVEPEMRLPMAQAGGVFMTIGFFWLGYASRSSVHWIVPTLSGIPQGIGCVLVFRALQVYLIDPCSQSSELIGDVPYWHW
ncbi:MFS multidrug transporter [Pseudohyphozyma bogoriensis]|nr:MFS multidrug transporter [Pseudohyphozyma bogoriensis]